MSEVTRHVRTHSLRCAINDIRDNLERARSTVLFAQGLAGGVVQMKDGTTLTVEPIPEVPGAYRILRTGDGKRTYHQGCAPRGETAWEKDGAS